jgi:hypothetical protein
MKAPAENKNAEVSSVLMVCLLFLVHTLTNSVLLSPLASQERCMFWYVGAFGSDILHRFLPLSLIQTV